LTRERAVRRDRAATRDRKHTLGVFDSGIGGLTVVRHLRRLLPAVALRSLERDFRGLPVDGVIQPGAESAVKATRSGRIGVIGTRATIQSRAYEHEIAVASRHAGKTTRVFANPCPLLVPLAEEGLAGSRAAREVLRVYLAPLRARKIDTLILGCTHYPPFKSAIRSVLGRRVTLIDSGEATARGLARALRSNPGPRGRGSLRCYVSDIPRQFEAVGRAVIAADVEPSRVRDFLQRKLARTA